MDPEILYFGHFEAEKIELVGEISEILKKDKFLIFWGVDILILRHSLKSKILCVQKKRSTYFQTAITPFKIDEITKAGRAQKRAGADLSNAYNNFSGT